MVKVVRTWDKLEAKAAEAEVKAAVLGAAAQAKEDIAGVAAGIARLESAAKLGASATPSRVKSEYSIKASDLKRRDSELGRGQNGVVYAASYHGQEVAAKVIDLRSVPKGDRPGVVDAFNREMEILVSLHSPRVLVVHG